MSHIVNTCVAPFCHSQNHSGGVPVPTGGMPAGVHTGQPRFHHRQSSRPYLPTAKAEGLSGGIR